MGKLKAKHIAKPVLYEVSLIIKNKNYVKKNKNIKRNH